MFQPTKLAIAVGLATCAISTSTLAATGHFSVGVQGAGGIAFVQNQYGYADTTTVGPANFALIDKMNESGSSVVGLFGGNIAYSWFWNTDILTARAEVNAGIGKTSTVSRPADGLTTTSQRGPNIEEVVKPKQQYNLTVEWKHELANHMFFLVGTGFSALNSDNIQNITRATTSSSSTIAISSISQEKFQYGGLFKIGAEYFWNTHSAINFSINYFMYADAKLRTFNGVRTASTAAEVNARKNNINLATFAIGYSYYF